jgi:hypothetical protein
LRSRAYRCGRRGKRKNPVKILTLQEAWVSGARAQGVDPVRSSHGHFVKASGVRWVSFMAMVPLPFSHRRWALPFLAILAPSQRHDDTKGKRHKSLADWARQGVLQIKCWLPNRLIVVVADSTLGKANGLGFPYPNPRALGRCLRRRGAKPLGNRKQPALDPGRDPQRGSVTPAHWSRREKYGGDPPLRPQS